MDKLEKNSSLEDEKRIITLEDLLDKNRIPAAEYETLIQAQEKRAFYSPEAYSEGWKMFLLLKDALPKVKKAYEFFIATLKNHPLIDLGGGMGDAMEKFAKECQINLLINVDRGIHRENTPVDPYKSTQEKTSENLHQIQINADMLDFTSRVKDNSANFVLNGIDRAVIPDHNYNEALSRELQRATCAKGIVFGIDSDIAYTLETLSFRKIDFNIPITGSFIFQKQ
jgi:hypothetical protein